MILISRMIKKQHILLVTLVLMSSATWAQSTTKDLKDFIAKFNVITTAVPFLQISPDARSGGLADAGLALSPDANSVYWNSAKLAFADKKGAVAINSAPWLKALIPDVWLHYLSGYSKIDNRSAWGGSLRYFSLGSIQFTDNQGSSLGQFTPQEWAIDGAYSRKLSEDFSVGVNLKFIYSNLAGRIGVNGNNNSKPGVAGAGDLSFYYNKETKISTYPFKWATGLVISNLGNKISYTSSQKRDFIPTNLRIGGNGTIDLDDYNQLGLIVEFEKLLVPTPPKKDDPTNPDKITSGKDPNVSVAQGVFQSFSDAPGGSKEEFREIIYKTALEYWYSKQFAARTGFYHESPYKGNRRYFTLGMGLRYSSFGLDFAYLIPLQQRNPLENTLRFSLHFNFGEAKK
jgi:hypothetical protein